MQKMSGSKSDTSKLSLEPSTSKLSMTSTRLRLLLEEDTNCSLKEEDTTSIKTTIRQKTRQFLKVVDYLVKLMINMHIGPAALDQERYRCIISELLGMDKSITSGEANGEELTQFQIKNFSERLNNTDNNIQDIFIAWTQHYEDTLSDVAEQGQQLIKLFDELKKQNKKQSTFQNNIAEFINYILAKQRSVCKLDDEENETGSTSVNTSEQVLERIQLLQKRLNTPFPVNFGNVPKLFGDSAKKEMKRKGKQKKGKMKKNTAAECARSEGGGGITDENLKKKLESSMKLSGQPEGSFNTSVKNDETVNREVIIGTDESGEQSVVRAYSDDYYYTNRRVDNDEYLESISLMLDNFENIPENNTKKNNSLTESNNKIAMNLKTGKQLIPETTTSV